ncbi:MAG TPA: helix-turn-helix domain-containing protein, partial [Rariglobus sp.]
MPRRITLRLIATQAGVDISTVSLAMRNSPRVQSATRDRIHKIATDLGYQPDAALAALVAYRNGVRAASYQSTLAWLDNWPVHGELRKIEAFNEYFLGAAG